jgi:hypothetical protein
MRIVFLLEHKYSNVVEMLMGVLVELEEMEITQV